MVPTTHRRTVTVILCAVALVAVSGCGGGDSAASSTATTVSTAPASSAAGQAYSSKAFVLPLAVTVDAALKSPQIRTPPTCSPGMPPR
jgi:hypothetical protein